VKGSEVKKLTKAFWVNLLTRAGLTGLLVGLAPIGAALSGGTFGDATLYMTALAVALGAVVSAVVTGLTTFVGDPASGTFTS
jgi:hypothetical protein